MSADAPSPPRASLLLVDDEKDSLLLLEAMLAPLGHKLVLARSGREALRHVLVLDFAAILLDVRMPVMDGLETASLIKERERSRHVPIVFLTANDETVIEAMTSYPRGAVDFLRKPLNPQILRSKITMLVDLSLRGAQEARGVPPPAARATPRHPPARGAALAPLDRAEPPRAGERAPSPPRAPAGLQRDARRPAAMQAASGDLLLERLGTIERLIAEMEAAVEPALSEPVRRTIARMQSEAHRLGALLGEAGPNGPGGDAQGLLQ